MPDGAFLKDSPIFKGVTDAQFETISFIVEDVTIPNGHLLFKEGAAAKSLFIIRSGTIEIVKESGTKEGNLLASLGEGQIFGEMAVIRESARSTAARAKGNCSLYTINREKLDTLRKKEPALWGTLMFNIASILCSRLSNVTARILAESKKAPAHEVAEKGFWARLTGH